MTASAAVRSRDPDRTRRLILDAARQVFAEKGLGGARVDAIAAAAGINKAMLYHYFGHKDDLFLAVLEEAYADIRNAELALDLTDVEPEAAMEQLIDFTWHYFVEHPEFITLLNSENLHRAEHLQRSHRIRAMHSPLVETISAILQRGEGCGVFRSAVDPIQLYISIASLGYFYLSNAHTLGTVFGRKLLQPRELRRRNQHVREVIMGYLRP